MERHPKTKRVLFMGLNSLLTLPPIKQLYQSLYFENDLSVVHVNINSEEDFFVGPRTIVYKIANCNLFSEFSHQNFQTKVLKYIKLVYFYLSIAIRREDKIDIFTFDIFSTFIASLVKNKDTKVIYIQYELIEIEFLSILDKLFLKLLMINANHIDLFVCPENNRLELNKKLFCKLNHEKFFCLPNSNNNNLIENSILLNRNKIIITHVGAIGDDNHFINELIVAIRLFDKDLFEFRFVGNISHLIREKLGSLGSNVKLFTQVKHSDLNLIYRETDIGLILYKGTSFNFEYCAPNKLYEFWSYGIPVIGHELIGLKSVFRDPCQGYLIDMNEPSLFLDAVNHCRFQSRPCLLNYFKDNFKLDIYIEELNLKLK
jgi:glycosyltransferase involved in cell wall biosynthesis